MLHSCARVTSPTGGEEDLDPPVLVRSVPEDGQLNFKGETILLVFDEIVQPNQIESNLIITPQPKGTFITRNNRNTIQLNFTEPFQDSTTYTFSFANSIRDVTARNPALDLTLSFSTGDYLDSLSIAGTILNLYDQLPAEQAIVSLFDANDSTNIINGSASYYTKTDTLGRYSFQNLPQGSYRVYAFQDRNNNNRADSDGEFYGFYTDTVNLLNNVSGIDFTIQKLSTKELRLLNGRQFGKYYDLTFNKSITKFQPQDSSAYVYQQIKPDVIRFYRTTELLNDTTNLIFEASDSLGVQLMDTARYFFSDSKVEPEPLNITVTPTGSFLKPLDTLSIKFNKPIISKDFDQTRLSLDSLNVYPFPLESAEFGPFDMNINIPIRFRDYTQRPDRTLTVTLDKGAFLSIDKDTSTLLTKNYTLAQENETAIISGRVNGNGSNIIVQLINSRTLDVIAEQRTNTFSFPYLNAGTYMLRVIQDINQNGKWDIGNILKNEAPEPATFYKDNTFNSQLIEVRKNWAVEGLVINLR